MSYGTATDARAAQRRALRARLVPPLSVAMLAVAAVVAAPASVQADPPPGRAYELVSPVDDPSGAPAGLSSEYLPMPGRASEDGDRLVYGANTVIGSSWSGGVNPLIFGRRTATGWEARSAIRSVDRGDTAMQLSTSEAVAAWMTNDGSELVFGSGMTYGDVPTPADGSFFPSIYRSTDTPAPPAWLSGPNAGIAPQPGVLEVPATADDTRVIAFSSTAPLTDDAPPAGTSAVYVRRDGKTTLVSRLPDGTVPVESTYLANGRQPPAASEASAIAMRNQLADGGRFVLFGLGATIYEMQLFVRDLERGVTHQLAGGGTGALANSGQLSAGWGGPGQFVPADFRTVPAGVVFAASAGPRAFFKPLSEDDATPAALYEADLETGVVTERTAITGPPLGLSADGRRMLFLEPPASRNAEEAWTLRYWDEANPGTSIAIGTIDAPGFAEFGLARVYRVSADGKSWVFTAVGSPDPDNPSAGGTAQQLYRWTVGDSHPTCLTCSPVDGVARTSGVNLTVQESTMTESFLDPTAVPLGDNLSKIKLAQPGHSISDDGRWLLFDSPDRLVGEDSDDVRDVYLWDRDAAPGKQLQLVSSGAGASPSYALDLDPTGRNAFFMTRESLVPADADGAYDVYTARIDGGFPGSPSSCTAEACRPSTSAPTAPLAGSIGFAGQGNAPSSPEVAKATVRVSKLKAVTGGAAKLKVRVSGAGRVAVAGSSILKATRSASRAGTYTLQVALSTRAKKSLKARGKLKVAVKVLYQPKVGRSASTSVTITFKQPKRAGAR